MCENHNFVVPVNILAPFVHVPFSWSAQHTTVCLDNDSKKSTSVDKMVFNFYEKRRIVYYQCGYKPPTIEKLLYNEYVRVLRMGVAKFLIIFNETGSLSRKPGSGRPPSIMPQMQAIVETKTRENNGTIAYQLSTLLLSHCLSISRRTVPHYCTQLGWTFRGSAYCQLIRHANKVKRLE